jgi:hypothetical protein
VFPPGGSGRQACRETGDNYLQKEKQYAKQNKNIEYTKLKIKIQTRKQA